MGTGADHYSDHDARLVIGGTSECVCFEVFNCYADSGDDTLLVYRNAPKLSPRLKYIHKSASTCVTYVNTVDLCEIDCHAYYDHIVICDARKNKIPEFQLSTPFPTAHLFHSYCETNIKIGAVEDGWMPT